MTKTHKQQMEELRTERRRQFRLLPVRIVMVLVGVGVMYLEGQHRPDPGVGFAVAMALFIGAVLIGWTHGDDK